MSIKPVDVWVGVKCCGLDLVGRLRGGTHHALRPAQAFQIAAAGKTHRAPGTSAESRVTEGTAADRAG